jgi:hypothetical protein
VYVDHHAINVVIVEHGEIIWSATAQLNAYHRVGDSAHMATALGGLLDGMPKYRWPKLRIDVAIGAPWSRVKLVRGVPSVRHHKEVIAMLRLNTSRFVASPRPVVITGASAASANEYRVGVAEVGVISAITGEICNRKLRIGQIIPAESIELEESSVRSSDDGIGETGEAIAAQVAMGHVPSQLALRVKDNPAITLPDVSRSRIAAAAAVLFITIGIHFAAQGYIDGVLLARNRTALRRMLILSDSGSQEKAELGRISRDLANAAKFSHRRISTALLLGAITQALPSEATVTTLRIDTANVDLVVLSPRTAAVVDAMSEVASIVAPTIIGPVSREMVGAHEMERATLRLHMLPDYSHAKSDFEPRRDESQ